MNPWSTDSSGTASQIDYRTSRCRCGAVVQPHEAVCTRCNRRQNLLFIGLDRLYEKDLDRLVEYHEREVKAVPNDYMRLYSLAGACLLSGDYKRAHDLYRMVIGLNPHFPDAHLNLGVILAVLGDTDNAVGELKEFIRLDLHSPKVERVVRAICSIKNIPYEDALSETGVKPAPDKQIRDPKLMRGGMYFPPPGPIIKKRSWGIVDIFLLFIILIVLTAWFLFPSRSKSVLHSAIAALESRYAFTVASGGAAETMVNENENGADAADDENDDEPGVINADPLTDSYLPLTTGNRWTYTTYETRSPSGTGNRSSVGSVEVRVSGMADSERGIWKVENGPLNVYYIEKATGLYSLSPPTFSWTTEIIQIPYPPDIGRSATDLGQTVTVEAVEIVETSVGLIECVKLHYTLKEPSDTEWYAWYGRDVGLVKYIGGGRNGIFYVRELRDYNLN